MPAPPADQPNVVDRSAPEGGWLSDSYRDDPNDIFTDTQDCDDTQDGANEDHATDEARDTGEAVEPADSADGARPESLVHRPDLPDGVAVHYGVDLTRRDGQLVRPKVFDGPPTRDQVMQGQIGDCGVIAALGAVAGHRPDAIEDLIETRQDGSHLVRLHDVWQIAPGAWEPTGRRIELAVSPDLPVSDAHPFYAAFANTHDTGVSWVAILEKALAGSDAGWPTDRAANTTHRGYDRLNQGSDPTDRAELIALLTGRPSAVHPVDSTPGNELAVERWLSERLDAHSPILVSTNAGDDEGDMPHGLTPSHAYEVVGAEDGRITLHNPWGRGHPAPLLIRDFLNNIVPLASTLRDGEETR